MNRTRLTWDVRVAAIRTPGGWEELDRFGQDAVSRTAAGGLYGFTKAIQGDCEAATRKLAKVALRIATSAYARDHDVVGFLATHQKRGPSTPARVLLAAMKEIGPKVAGDLRTAGAQGDYGLYGFKARTADIGLDACRELRGSAGHISAELHRRRAEVHDQITGFLGEHSKQGRCVYSKMLQSCYPDAGMKLASAVGPAPTGWLVWEE